MKVSYGSQEVESQEVSGAPTRTNALQQKYSRARTRLAWPTRSSSLPCHRREGLHIRRVGSSNLVKIAHGKVAVFKAGRPDFNETPYRNKSEYSSSGSMRIFLARVGDFGPALGLLTTHFFGAAHNRIKEADTQVMRERRELRMLIQPTARHRTLHGPVL
jgi:hypothetical protein